MNKKAPPNIDVLTGIHLGVLGVNELDSWFYNEEVIVTGEDLSMEAAKAEVKHILLSTLADVADGYGGDGESFAKNWVTDEMICEVLEHYSPDNDFPSVEYRGEENSYHIVTTDSGTLFVDKSDYVAYVRQCSPCYPNAGDLTATNGSLPTYALPHECFDGGKAPYKLYRRSDNHVVYPDGTSRPAVEGEAEHDDDWEPSAADV